MQARPPDSWGTQPRFSKQKMAEAMKNIVVNNIPLQKSAAEHSKKVLGLENLREYQLEALSGLLQGRDTIISQPTGSGKSVVYQLLPFAFDIHDILRSEEKSEETKGKLIDEVVNSKKTKSIVVVIQPLISLMKDQMMTLKRKKINVFRLMHSLEESGAYSQDKKSSKKLDNARREKLINHLTESSIVFASPEAVLDSHRIMLRCDDLRGKIVCVAIDEGHCIIKW